MSLLIDNTLVFQQVTAMVTNDFAILDGEGQVAGRVETHGSLGSLLAKGSRHFTVRDVDDQPVLIVRDPLNLVRDTFELQLPDSSAFAQVRRRFVALTTRLDISLASGALIELKGTLTGLKFTFTTEGHMVARVSRTWPGLAKGLLGRSSYTLTFEPETPVEIRRAVIGTMVVLDLVRHKDNNS